MKPYTSDITFYSKSVKEILKRGYKVQWKIHVFSLLCCVPHWRRSMTFCFKGFTLYRLTVCVRVCVFVFQAHTPQSSLLFLSFTLLHNAVFRAGNLFSASMQFYTSLSTRVESCALVYVSCTNTWLHLEHKTKHPFYRTLLIPQYKCFSSGFEMFCLISSPSFFVQ